MHKGVKQGVNPLKWVQIRAERAQEGMKKAREIGLFWMVAATDLIVHIREHLPILLGTRVTALREPQNRKAVK